MDGARASEPGTRDPRSRRGAGAVTAPAYLRLPGRRDLLWALAVLLGLLVAGCAQLPGAGPGSWDRSTVAAVGSGALRVKRGVVLSGVPEGEHLDRLARADVLVIDLRSAGEPGVLADRGRARAAGLEVRPLPTDGGMPEAATLERLRHWLAGAGDRPVLLHCRSGNRAGILWAAHRLEAGDRPEDVLAEVRPVLTGSASIDVVEELVGKVRPRSMEPGP